MVQVCVDFFHNKDPGNFEFFYEEENHDNFVGNDDQIYAGTKILLDDSGDFCGIKLEEPVVLHFNLPENVHEDYGKSIKIVYKDIENLN